jgi:signal transduction histidine kinase
MNEVAEHTRGREPSRRLLEVAEREVGRIILDIHDGPVQNIFAALSQLNIVHRAITNRCGDSATNEVERIRQSIVLLENSLNEIRTFMGLFRPPEFERRTLLSLLDGLVIQHEELTSSSVSFTVQGTIPEVPLPVKIGLYRVLQQALSNSSRHAQVDEQFVSLICEGETIRLEVSDQGIGFNVDEVLKQHDEIHYGLAGMRERVEILGGTFEIESSVGTGTRIRVAVPCMC